MTGGVAVAGMVPVDQTHSATGGIRRLVDVGRLHLVDRYSYTWLSWGVLAFTFAVNVAIFAIVPAGPTGNYTGAVSTIYIFMTVVGTISITRYLPFGLSLGLSRRTYYLGTLGLIGALAALNAVLMTVLYAVESATHGWGLDLHFFRVPWLLDGPWYQVLLTSLVFLLMFYLLGMWGALLHARWGMVGVVVTVAVLVLVLLAAGVAITLGDGWPAIGRFFVAAGPAGLTGLIAVLVVLLAGAGYGTIRKLTV